MNYEYLKELPRFTDHCDQRLEGKLPSISEIRQRHCLMQGLTSLNLPYDKTNRLAQIKRRCMIDDYDDSVSSRPYFRSHIYPDYSLNVQDWRHKDDSIDRIIDENTGRPTRYYHRGIDNLDFLNNNFYQNSDKLDLKIQRPRKGFASSLIYRTMYW